MAVYQGARLRRNPLAATAADADAVPAPRIPLDSNARTRVRPTGLLVAAIVASTILGLAYLTQTLGSNATATEISWLQESQYALEEKIDRDVAAVLREGDEDAVRTRARHLGLKQLGSPLVLRAP